MRAVRDFVVAHLADPDGLTVLVLDESMVEKPGMPRRESNGSTSAALARCQLLGVV